MKRYGHLFEKVVDPENIKLAILQASKGKRNHRNVKRVLDDIDTYVMRIQTMLLSCEYQPSHVAEKGIMERGKHRIITSSPFFPDQIIHWALMLVLQPVFLKSMYEYNMATIPSRGTGQGRRVLVKWLKSDPKHTKYCLKMDVHHFYPSIDQGILKQKLKHRFKDERVLKLLFDIIDCYSSGLPLGFYTSQWLANFYLESLDHKIKNDWGATYYMRYMDDLVILGPNKRKLRKLELKITGFLANEKLQTKGNWQVFHIRDRPIDFLGFRFYRSYLTLRSSIALRIRRRLKRIKQHTFITTADARVVISYWGWLKHSNSFNFYQKYVKPNCSIKTAKKVIKNANKRRSS